MSFRFAQRWLVPAFYFLVASSLLAAPPTTRPVDGLRENPPTVRALTNARLVVAPGEVIEKGNLILRDGVIVALGAEAAVPADAEVRDLAGKTIYPGLLDAWGEQAISAAPGAAPHWNAVVTPELHVADHYQPDPGVLEKLRSQGIVARLVAPAAGVLKGTSVVAATGSAGPTQSIWNDQAALHVRLGVPFNRSRGGYPSSPMGAVALARQAFLDAQWYGQAWSAHSANSLLPRPERNDALEALRGYLADKRVVVFDAPNELYFLRAAGFAREFSLTAIVRGSGQEYQRLEAIRATGLPVLVPVQFPRPPAVGTPEANAEVELDELLHWDLAPENPARLAAAGVKIALTSDGLRDAGEFLGAVRTAVARGLSAEAALRALTTTPAELLGVSHHLGSLAVGKSASLVVTDGDLFAKETKLEETWVHGERFEITPRPSVDLRGEWQLEVTSPDGVKQTPTARLTGAPGKLDGVLLLPPTQPDGKKPLEIKLNKLAFRNLSLTGTLPGKELGQTGILSFSAVIVSAPGEPVQLAGKLAWPNGATTIWRGQRTGAVPAKDSGGDSKKDAAADAAKPDEKPEKTLAASYPVVFPLGAFGRPAPPVQPKHVFFRNATVWTCGPQGTLTETSVLVTDGKVAAIGKDLPAPADALVVDATGKHLTPGIIDCHSHMATDGGVNEGTQAITAEVRVGDFVDCDDINIYRQLAGGVTAANILHGSANPIGGQNQVIKLRWGSPYDELRFAEAPPGIKFALGENVKRSNFEEGGPARYPQSRMGVEQIIRDAFFAAREYQREWERWEKQRDTLPPRRDLELEALVEILAGQRWVHCHSYRQDEILALLRTCEEFGIRVATLQHILEGYKVADAMARHGAMGSSFSDWWAYKIEVYDAIPFNGALMHRAGVVVSFNSDDQELARHLNHEAAKAMKYGQIPADEALKFVTLNPARQLRIDHLVGSLELGKHADLVVWSGPPLSVRSRCEQTWIDGRRYFDLGEDQQARVTAQQQRQALIQKVLESGQTPRSPDDAKKPDEELWPRFDIYCRTKGAP